VDQRADLRLLLEIPHEVKGELLSRDATLRSVAGLDEDLVKSVLSSAFRDEAGATGRKKAFMHTLTAEIRDKGFISPSDLYQKKFSMHGDVEELFQDEQLDALFEAIKHFAPAVKS